MVASRLFGAHCVHPSALNHKLCEDIATDDRFSRLGLPAPWMQTAVYQPLDGGIKGALVRGHLNVQVAAAFENHLLRKVAQRS